MSYATRLATGSDTGIYNTAPGGALGYPSGKTLFSVIVDRPVAGGSLVVSTAAGGLGATPNYNSDALPGLVLRSVVFPANPAPVSFDFKGLACPDGVTVALTSNCGATVLTD